MKWIPCIAWFIVAASSWFAMGYIDSHYLWKTWWANWACIWLFLQSMCASILTVSLGGIAWVRGEE